MTSLTDEELLAHGQRVDGKTVVITGAANGIGRDTALLFASYGAKIIIGDIDEAGAANVVKEIISRGGVAACRQCNVAKWEDQVALFDIAMKTFGSVDIVIPNAGIAESSRIWDLQVVDGKPQPPNLKTIEINLISVLYTVNLAFHYLKADPMKRDADTVKAIVLIGSMASWQGLGTSVLYSTSKHGILGLMRAMAPMCTAKGIRVGSIHPWFAETQILGISGHVFLAGVPLTPVQRIAATILCVVSDPDPKTSERPWLLPDHGEVLRLDDTDLTEGSYAIVNARVKKLMSATIGIRYRFRVIKDLASVFAPVLKVATLLLVGLYIWRKI